MGSRSLLAYDAPAVTSFVSGGVYHGPVRGKPRGLTFWNDSPFIPFSPSYSLQFRSPVQIPRFSLNARRDSRDSPFPRPENPPAPPFAKGGLEGLRSIGK